MALLTQDYFCPSIGMATELRVVLPDVSLANGRDPEGTLFLLSPEGESGLSWITSTKLKALCEQYDTAAVLVPCLQGCYTDMVFGYPFYQSLKYAREYIKTYLPGVPVKSGRIAAAGASVGGAAALRWAMEEPEDFCACASFSGLLDPCAEPGGWFTASRIADLYGDYASREILRDDFLRLCRETQQTRCFIFSGSEDPGNGSSETAAAELAGKCELRKKDGRSDWKTWSDELGEFFRWWKGGQD